MIKFSQDKVLLLHQLLIEQTGGEDGVRDFGLLDSALEACYATFDGKELFPSKEEKAARLGVGLVSNHAFVDGNKRIWSTKRSRICCINSNIIRIRSSVPCFIL